MYESEILLELYILMKEIYSNEDEAIECYVQRETASYLKDLIIYDVDKDNWRMV